MLTQAEVADRAHVTVRTLQRWRALTPPQGPRCTRLSSNTVRVAEPDYDAWEAARAPRDLTEPATEQEVADFLRISVRTLQRWAGTKPPQGPPRYRGGRVGGTKGPVQYEWPEVRTFANGSGST